MKLRFITAAGTAVVTLAVVAVVLEFGHRVLNRSYATLEARHLQQDLKRTLALIDLQAENLNVLTRDYATWDDTWRYMKNPNREYLTSNYGDLSLKNLNLQMIMLTSPEGKNVFCRRTANFDPGLDDEKMVKLLVGRTLPGANGDYGLLELPKGPVLVSYHPILRSNGEGPTRGTMIMIREADYHFVARISELAQQVMILQPLDRVTVPAWREAMAQMAAGQSSVVQQLDPERVTAFARVNDLTGRPILLLRIEHDREIWSQGQYARRMLMWLVISLGLLHGAVNLAFIHRFIVRRLEKMINFTAGISADRELHRRIELEGNDEIARLGDTLNRMLDDLQMSQKQLISTGEQLQYEATHDSLTGAWNRAAGLQILDRELDRSAREQSQVAVIMLDLDHFKKVNDRYGHSAGDAVLKHFMTMVLQNLRTFDALVRYGGEEFLIIAPNCGMNEARTITHRILHNLRTATLTVNQAVVNVTASAGVTAGGAPCTSEELIAIADRAMYRAKANGRDCAQFEESRVSHLLPA
jgi:diguanylate cyclase (GGDEF)-like protein